MEREQKKMAANNLKLDAAEVSIRKVGKIVDTELGCTRCEKSFVNMLMLKKHYKDAHTGQRQTLSLDASSEKEEQTTALMSGEKDSPRKRQRSF